MAARPPIRVDQCSSVVKNPRRADLLRLNFPPFPEEVAWWPAGAGCLMSPDFKARLMSAAEMQALVLAWQSGAISRDTFLHNFRT